MSIEFVKPLDEDISFTIDSQNTVDGDVTLANDLLFDIGSDISVEGIADTQDGLEFDIGSLEANELQFDPDQTKSMEASVNVDTVYRGIGFTTDETLTLDNGKLSVNTAQHPELDNTLPITAAAVHTTVGNIEILLKTI